ncbi:hypothetical protein EST38_g10377 [Candolleomyces aberdarensis]|uniref:SAP domain-containing protein n=1 Tax=Candolleomyces aberdarensis TaxID=2316362 RepID=A0A4Q2D9Z3_9AGAR|nr:hypothetical protein EST38_g10377 [Candolleomyces aberdarensis]
MDGLNAYGNKDAGKKFSIGAIYMVCLNLPETIRYDVENVYLVGIIPGPDQPSCHQINHLLKPLIDDFLVLWDSGLYLSRTYLHSTGVRVHGAIIPLVCDLPASRQMSGYAGFQSNQFSIMARPLRKAVEWERAQSREEQETLHKENGIRWSELLRLPYWDPTEYTLIDSMHAFYLRIFQHHIRNVWGMSVKFDDGDGIMFNTSRDHPTEVEMRHGHFVIRHGAESNLKELKVPLLRELCQELELDYRGKRKELTKNLIEYRIQRGWFSPSGAHIPSEDNDPLKNLPVSRLDNGKTTDECFWSGSKSQMKRLKKHDLLKVYKEQVLPGLSLKPSEDEVTKYEKKGLLALIQNEVSVGLEFVPFAPSRYMLSYTSVFVVVLWTKLGSTLPVKLCMPNATPMF